MMVNWFGNEQLRDRPEVKPNEATLRAHDELEMCLNWAEFVEICRKQKLAEKDIPSET